MGNTNREVDKYLLKLQIQRKLHYIIMTIITIVWLGLPLASIFYFVAAFISLGSVNKIISALLLILGLKLGYNIYRKILEPLL